VFYLSWFCVLAFLVFYRSYFVPLVLALGAAAAGEALAAGLGLFVGVLAVAGVGELDAAGVGVEAPVVFESVAGSQATANRSENVATSKSAMRLAKLIVWLLLGFFIIFPLIPIELKSGMIIARSLIGSNGRSHRRFAGISPTSGLKPSFSKR
jgi:hypothetical protein